MATQWEVEGFGESAYPALRTFQLVPTVQLSCPRAALPLRSRTLHNTSNGCHYLDTAGITP